MKLYLFATPIPIRMLQYCLLVSTEDIMPLWLRGPDFIDNNVILEDLEEKSTVLIANGSYFCDKNT